MKVTVKGNNPITGDNIKYVFDKLNEEYKPLDVQIKNVTCYVRFALENGEGKNVEIKDVPERTFVFTEEVQSNSNTSDNRKEEAPFGSKISVYKTALKNNDDYGLYDYCVSRRGGRASKVKFNEAELKRVLDVLLKENGIELEAYNIYFNSEVGEATYTLLNECNGTVFFYIQCRGSVGKYQAYMELPDEGCYTIWIEPCKEKDNQIRTAVFARYTPYSCRDLALFLGDSNPDEFAEHILKVLELNPSVIDSVKDTNSGKVTKGATPEMLVSECYHYREGEEYEVTQYKREILNAFYDAVEDGRFDR